MGRGIDTVKRSRRTKVEMEAYRLSQVGIPVAPVRPRGRPPFGATTEEVDGKLVYILPEKAEKVKKVRVPKVKVDADGNEIPAAPKRPRGRRPIGATEEVVDGKIVYILPEKVTDAPVRPRGRKPIGATEEVIDGRVVYILPEKVVTIKAVRTPLAKKVKDVENVEETTIHSVNLKNYLGKKVGCLSYPSIGTLKLLEVSPTGTLVEVETESGKRVEMKAEHIYTL